MALSSAKVITVLTISQRVSEGRENVEKSKGHIIKDVLYSKAQKMLKFTFNALIQQLLLQLLQKYLLWLRPLHTAKKHHPTMFTVRHKRSGPNILYNTSLTMGAGGSNESMGGSSNSGTLFWRGSINRCDGES